MPRSTCSAFREELQVDLGIGPSKAAQYRSSEIGMKPLQRAHRIERYRPQLDDPARMLVRLVEGAIGSKLGLDLVVARQRFGLGGAEDARGLALRERKVVDAVLGHDASGGRSDPRAHSGLAAHACDSIIESRPSMAAAHLHILGICGTF